VLVIFEIGSCFIMPRPTWTTILLFVFFHIDRCAPPRPAIG
jgi:hypothetical protein